MSEVEKQPWPFHATPELYTQCTPQSAYEAERMLEYAHQLLISAVMERNEPRIFALLQVHAPVSMGGDGLTSNEWSLIHHFVETSDKSETDAALLTRLLADPYVRHCINHCRDMGETALYDAIYQRNDAVACVLLEHGARIDGSAPRKGLSGEKWPFSKEWLLVQREAWRLPKTCVAMARLLTLTPSAGVALLEEFADEALQAPPNHTSLRITVSVAQSIGTTLASYGELHPEDEAKLFAISLSYLDFAFREPMLGGSVAWREPMGLALFDVFAHMGVDMVGARADPATAQARHARLRQATHNNAAICARLDGAALDQATTLNTKVGAGRRI